MGSRAFAVAAGTTCNAMPEKLRLRRFSVIRQLVLASTKNCCVPVIVQL